MRREERKNMIEFIQKMKGLQFNELMYMTDEEVEHIYNVTYYQLQVIAE